MNQRHGEHILRMERMVNKTRSAILGLVEMLTEVAPEKLSLQEGSLQAVSVDARPMSGIVHHLLDGEPIEWSQQPFHPLPLDVNALIRRVVEAQQHQAECKHVGLLLDLGARPALAPLDEPMMERLLANLISNAVKFTPQHGAIRVSTRRLEMRLVIEVWNSGSSIPASLETAMFEKFVRHSSRSGCGLGLDICRSIVATHRGRISAHNTNDGVAFVVELPMMRQ